MSNLVNVTVTINGEERSAEVEPRMLLVHFIRDVLGITGSHIGCDTSQCGNCTILVDGRAAKSCTLLAVHVDGSELITVEGLGTVENLHPVQRGFWEEHGLQCGYCTPGAMIASIELLAQNPTPTDEEIREGLEGVICRCTGYEFIVNAVRRASEIMREENAVKGVK
ncbi:MAG TPA: (2Fe-2S)-binding protein [Candidatus Pseudogracilibacillus intestinigallinarum]|uniref:(2Fe-2S)-binding protein n=1 Tax=Candidatus Pseudogracilibacillus intestinigallinarum TaxID=2838742 RepID=A0A9D1PL87_9BACI|nr:(2Fe-2S)-binding protein [Candidatus Pseudogracilibacillus intestinigallinarum]